MPGQKDVILYDPHQFDVVMKDPQPITEAQFTVNSAPEWFVRLHELVQTLHHDTENLARMTVKYPTQDVSTFRELYENVRRDYLFSSGALQQGVELTMNQVMDLEQRVVRHSSTFAREVWSYIARFSSQQEERDEAINQLKDVAHTHHQTLHTLQAEVLGQHQELLKQQKRQSSISRWAAEKDDQINNLFQRSQQGEISQQEQSMMKQLQELASAAAKEALAQQQEKGKVDHTSVFRKVVQRTARSGSIDPIPEVKIKKSQSSKGKEPMNPLSGEALRRAAAREVTQMSERQLAGMQSRDFVYQGNDFQGPPEPPRNNDDPSDSDGSSSDSSGREGSNRRSETPRKPAQSVEERVLALLESGVRQGPTISMNKPEKYNGKDKAKFIPWWRSTQSYIEVHIRNFTSGRQKIKWIGSLIQMLL